MKKILLSTLLFVSALLLFNSCSKDEEYSLNNTTWLNVTGDVKCTLEFSATECRSVITGTNTSAAYVLDYYYTLSYPNVLLSAKKSGVANLEGKISSNQMTVTNTSTSKSLGIYIKQ